MSANYFGLTCDISQQDIWENSPCKRQYTMKYVPLKSVVLNEITCYLQLVDGRQAFPVLHNNQIRKNEKKYVLSKFKKINS